MKKSTSKAPGIEGKKLGWTVSRGFNLKETKNQPKQQNKPHVNIQKNPEN